MASISGEKKLFHSQKKNERTTTYYQELQKSLFQRISSPYFCELLINSCQSIFPGKTKAFIY